MDLAVRARRPLRVDGHLRISDVTAGGGSKCNKRLRLPHEVRSATRKLTGDAAGADVVLAADVIVDRLRHEHAAGAPARKGILKSLYFRRCSCRRIISNLFDSDASRPLARSEEHTSELQSRENLVC